MKVRRMSLSQLVPKPRSQGQSVSPPNILAGSKSRLKDLVLDKFPSREMGNSKLPKGEKVMLCFFHHLLQDPDRISNSNKWTVASSHHWPIVLQDLT